MDSVIDHVFEIAAVLFLLAAFVCRISSHKNGILTLFLQLFLKTHFAQTVIYLECGNTLT